MLQTVCGAQKCPLYSHFVLCSPSHTKTICAIFSAMEYSGVVHEKDIKLYNFCKSNIGSFSRRELRDYFQLGNILVNGIRIRKGHHDETMRLCVGDVVCLKVLEDGQLESYSTALSLDQAFDTDWCCVFNKPTGCSVSEGKEYEVAIRAQLWDGKFHDNCKFLYRLEKSIGGLSIAVKSHDDLLRLRKSLAACSTDGSKHSQFAPDLQLTYQALVCGLLGEEGETASLSTNYPDCPNIELQILQTCRSRSADHLSLINITPTFNTRDMGMDSLDAYQLFESDNRPGVDKSDWYTSAFLHNHNLLNPVTNGDNKILNHPTRHLKAIRCALMRAGHGIVGDRDLVKKSKGLYAALVGVTFRGQLAADSLRSTVDVPNRSSLTSSITNASDVTTTTVSATVTVDAEEQCVRIELPTPPKFLKLLEREERMWQAAKGRDQEVLAKFRSRAATKDKTTTERIDEDISDAANDAGEGNNGDMSGDSDSDNEGTGAPVETSASRRPPDVPPITGKTNAPSSARSSAVDASGDVPVEYITGEALFCGLRYHVSPAVMIPRRSSEALVREAVRCVVEDDQTDALSTTEGLQVGERGVVRVLDLGTGSGCLLLSTIQALQSALKTEDPGAASTEVSGVGLDISADALAVAQRNADSLALKAQLSFVEGSFEKLLYALNQLNQPDLSDQPDHQPDLQDPLQDAKRSRKQKLGRPFDLILCNPPYSSRKDRSRLSAACRKHEPALALFAPKHTNTATEGGSEEGTMGAYYMIARSLVALHQHDSQCRLRQQAAQTAADAAHARTEGELPEPTLSHQQQGCAFFKVGAHLILEMGHGQESDVMRIISTGAHGWKYVRSVRDHLDLVRCVVFRYSGENMLF